MHKAHKQNSRDNWVNNRNNWNNKPRFSHKSYDRRKTDTTPRKSNVDKTVNNSKTEDKTVNNNKKTEDNIEESSKRLSPDNNTTVTKARVKRSKRSKNQTKLPARSSARIASKKS